MVVDAGNGTGGPVMHRILERLNVEATEMFFEMDGRFPNHHPDPTVPAQSGGADRHGPRDQGADLGIAFDGDTDRIGAVDERGTIVYGDQLMIIYAPRNPHAQARRHLHRRSEMLAAACMTTSRARGGNPIMWKTGHSLIKAKMKETHAELAGEMSGHMFFADRYYGFDDALYAACRLMEIVANSGRPLSSQLADLPQTVTTPEIRFDCPDELKFEVVRRAAERFRAHAQDRGCGRRARAVPRRLGPGARLQHAAGAGDALRSLHAGVVGAVPARDRSRGRGGGRAGLSAGSDMRVGPAFHLVPRELPGVSPRHQWRVCCDGR